MNHIEELKETIEKERQKLDELADAAAAKAQG